MNFKLAVGLFLLVISGSAFAATDDDRNLIAAAGKGDLAVFNMMLGWGANPDALDKGGNSAILMAAYYERRDMVRRLIELNVDVNAKGSIGYTPVGVAAMRDDPEILGMLIKNGAKLDVHDGAKGTPLLNAIQFQYDENVRMLLAAGANADLAGAFGMTPLMMAAQMGRADYVDALLAKGADVNMRGDQQSTALYFALFEGHDDIARKLIRAGANLRLPVNGYTPLHWARVMDRADIVPLMVEAGAIE